MASYYFQEDSDESFNFTNSGSDASQNKNKDDTDETDTLQLNSDQSQNKEVAFEQQLTASPSASKQPEGHPPDSKETVDCISQNSPKSKATLPSVSSNISKILKKTLSSEDLEKSQSIKMEDTRSLAIAIENQDMVSRADLEESLLRNLYTPIKSLESENVSILHASTDKHLPWALEGQQHSMEAMRFVPQTRVFCINKQYRSVFLVDVSSSVLTVDSEGTKVIMSQVMDALTKCLSGLSDEFSCPGMRQNFVQPEIHITVIAECSQFASNLNTGEMLADFPTMKVLLQDVVVTIANLHSILKILRVQLSKFQTRLSRFRAGLRQKREKYGYLYSFAMEDGEGDVNAELDVEDDVSQRKSWGVGLSGANLSYTLTAGLFALGMMPCTASPSLVLITDGVVKSNLLHGSTILRRFMELDVSCSIIQLGNQNEAVPSCNWGFVQDTEILRFVAEATLGKFMYSQECTTVDPFNKTRIQGLGRVAPNIYHRSFLIRELCLLKPRPGLDDMDDKEDSVGYSLANFPWDPKSVPEPIKMMQTTCRDYPITALAEILVTTRIRQGFRIKGVSIAPDKERQSGERYVITMTLAWLPNVTVQYKLKGQVSNSSINTDYLSRFENPKVEIDIIAYQAFALHFLNTRDAPSNTSHSVYAKVYRIHRYIVGLGESDYELCKLNNSHASANQAIWTQRAKQKERLKSSIPVISIGEQEKEDLNTYISRLSEQWSGIAKDFDYSYSRGWYSEHEFDIVLAVPPPVFLPQTMDTKNSLVKYTEGLESTLKGIRDNLRVTWASFVVGDVLIRTFQSPEPTSSTTAGSQFCELRLFSEPNIAVVRVQLRFFGASIQQRKSTLEDLKTKVHNFQTVQPESGGSKLDSDIVPAKVLSCRRPIYRLLMRHLIYEVPLAQIPESMAMDFHTHVSEPLGEESVLRSYLTHKNWWWKDQVRDPAYLQETTFVASQDLAYQYLCAQRLGEGFVLVSASPNRAVFYKEIDIPEMKGSLLRGLTTAQYIIFRSPISGELVTELWMEPSLDACRWNMFDATKARIITVDRFIMSQLATFEAIHTIGRLRLRPEVNVQPERGFMYPWLFDPATLLRQQRLVTLAFEAPQRLLQPKHNSDTETEKHRRCVHTLGLGVVNIAEGTLNALASAPNSGKEGIFMKNLNTSTTSLSQSLLEAEVPTQTENDLSLEYRDLLRELCCAERDLALLHLFMEKSLSRLSDGEIMPGGEDDACTQHFDDLRTSIRRSPEVRQTLMTFHCVISFEDIRCFVKSFNSNFFRLIIIPRLGSVISHLVKLRSLPLKEQEVQAGIARQDFLGCFMFECRRSKPLGDISDFNSNALDQNVGLIELYPVTIAPTITQQPLILQPIVNGDQENTKLQESTLQLIRSISTAYSHSFAKVTYASLVEGHPISNYDLKKVCQICTRTNVEINITSFLNTMEQGRRNGMTSSDEPSEIMTRFMAVLKHSFEPVPVVGSDQTYFYRPLLRKIVTKQAKPKSRKRSPSVSRSGSIDSELEDALPEVIDCAEKPLFLQLECSFMKPVTPILELEKSNLKSSVTFPVNDIPVSYVYKDKDSQEYDYAPTSIGLESRPVASADGTAAMLHLVILTLPMPDDYAGPTLKTIDSESKINMENSQTPGTRSLHHLFPTLDPMQSEAIAETEARLDWLVKEEVMHGLLNVAPVTVDILGLVESQLKTKNIFVNFPTAMTLPLTFAKKKRGHEIFMQELGQTNMYPYELHQVEQYFYLTEGDDSLYDQRTESDPANINGNHVNQSEIDLLNDDLPSLSNNLEKESGGLCHGLGIVILPEPKSNQILEQGSGSLTKPRKKRSFWMIMVPKDSYLQIYFFTKVLSEEACSSILSHVRKSIDDLCVKVNQLTLLQSLNESRTCSRYLVPDDDSEVPDSESGSDSDHLSQEDEALVTGGSKPSDADQSMQRKFSPGEFACPLVHRVAWPLHWRVKPGQAMKSVAHLVLYQFAVSNRKNFFVVESQDDYDESKKIVVYLRLSEVEVHPDTEPLNQESDKSEESTNYPSSSSQVPEDAGSHSNSPKPSPTASPGSRAIVPSARTETRELVIEVYGVQRPGKKVTTDLFNMLESKFYNSVVLPTVATFLSRNSALKLTQADVEFILPVDRFDPARQILEIPHFINVPYAFLMYLKQNLSLYLNPLTGSDKVGILSRYYSTRYGRLSMEKSQDRANHSHKLQIGDFSFFYNAVQGRAQTPTEIQVGTGVAGVCLTVLGQDMRPVFEVGYQEGDRDKEDIEKYFASFPNCVSSKSPKYSLIIEVWAQGNVDASALLDLICKSFRQSLCDDIIEASIVQGLCPSARDRRNDVDELDGEPLIGERIQKNFIDPSFKILQHSFQWKNPAVQFLSLEYSMPPWIMDSFLLELDEIMTDVSVHFSPLLIRSMANSNRYKEYKASSGTRKSFGDMTNIRFILIGGIQDLGDGTSSSYYGRRTSTGSDRTHSRRSSLAEGQSIHHSHKTSTHSSQLLPKRQLEDIKMYPNAITSSGQDETMLSRNCFVAITANGFGLQVYTYNWGKAYHEFMFSAIEKVVKWHKDRMRFLDNILLQKMGLFHHVPSMLSTALVPNQPTTSQSTPAITPSLNHGHSRIIPQSSPHLGSNLRVNQPDSVGSLPNITKTATTSPKSVVTSNVLSETSNLACLVDDQFPSRARLVHVGGSFNNEESRSDVPKSSSSTLNLISRSNPTSSTSIQSHIQSQINSQTIDQTPIPTNNVISPDLDVDQILREHCLEPLEAPRDDDQIQDEVQRHGKPFLDTFTTHMKNVEDQQNAFNVYQKWSRRYKDRKGAPNAIHENMNTSDLAIMLRSSRLLHFCRTPLLFTEFSSSLFQLAKDSPSSTTLSGIGQSSSGRADISSNTDDSASTHQVLQWYGTLAETFMREYSQYLVTVGMQLLMYGNSKFDKPVDSSQPGEFSFMSQFTVSQTLSVPSPAAFLFKSLQGGSIMCEVRLQGMFVCVTLYTLNRRYGRVKVAAPGFHSAEANKQSLRVFTEQCTRFKDRIHVNSFVYDFHLRYTHRILMESSKLGIPGSSNADVNNSSTPLGALPFSFDLLDVLHQFLQYHSRPAAYSRNRVYRGVYRSNVTPGEGELPKHLFEYVIKNPQRYGFQVIQHQNRPRACFISGKDLLAGFNGKSKEDSLKLDHPRNISEGTVQNLKGFGVGTNRGGLPPNNDKRAFGAHARHTSHDSNLNTKRLSRKLTTSRSTYTIKESSTLEEDGVEYVLVVSDGEQDCLGLTVHYYLIILRSEDVAKKLEERHGPLVGAKDRVLAASRNPMLIRESTGSSPISQSLGASSRSSFIGSQLQQLRSLEEDSQSQLYSGQSQESPDNDSEKTSPHAQALSSEERLMDATELQERITDHAVLADVVRAAEVRLDLMLKQAAQFFDRDSLWEMLLQGKIGNSGVILTGSNPTLVCASHNASTPTTAHSTETTDYLSHKSNNQSHSGVRHSNISPSSAELGFADFLALGQRFHSTPLQEMEPDFREIVMAPEIDWDEVLTFLARYYSRWAREFMEHDETHSPGPAVSSLRPRHSQDFTGPSGRRGSLGLSLRPQKTRRHLVIFNPQNRDLLVHFVINTSTSKAGKNSGSFLGQYSRHNNSLRTSTADLHLKSYDHNPENHGLERGKPQSQSYSQLQVLLHSSSQLPMPPQNQSEAQNSGETRTSLHDPPSRVSSMTSIARAATLAVTKVANRLQSRSREPSTNILNNNQSEPGSSSPSVMVAEDDNQSIVTSTTSATGRGESRKTSLYRAAQGVGSGAGSTSLLSPDGRATRRTRKISSNSIPNQSRKNLSQQVGLGIESKSREIRERQSTTGSERFNGQYSENNSLIDSETRNEGSEDLDQSNSISFVDDNESGQYQFVGDDDDDDDDDDIDNIEDEDMDTDLDDEDGYEKTGANVRVFSVSRELKVGCNEVEAEHVSDIIRTLSYWIWKSQK